MRDDVVLPSPRSLEERRDVARRCVDDVKLEIPALIDDFANTTDEAYTGWPDRLYVIDRDGRIAYKSKPGPFGFKPDEVRAVLGRLVGEPGGRS